MRNLDNKRIGGAIFHANRDAFDYGGNPIMGGAFGGMGGVFAGSLAGFVVGVLIDKVSG